MAAAMVHRGPDEDGFLVNDSRAPGAAMGMRRLSIIDLPGGHQPVWNEARNVAVVFNGELYNYRELRERLLLAGHRFTTSSDTEILVHGWEEWGEDLLGELRGMFAFALLDMRKHFATVPVLFLRAIRWESNRCITHKQHMVSRLHRSCAPCWRREPWIENFPPMR